MTGRFVVPRPNRLLSTKCLNLRLHARQVGFTNKLVEKHGETIPQAPLCIHRTMTKRWVDPPGENPPKKGYSRHNQMDGHATWYNFVSHRTLCMASRSSI